MCTRNELNCVLSDTHKRLCDIFGKNLQNVYLYGSYARGEQTEESDIDVIAIVDLTKEQLAEHRRTVSDFSSELDLQYGVLLSVKLQDMETFTAYRNTLPFFKNVIKEGIPIVQ